jgi:hypothetical protein
VGRRRPELGDEAGGRLSGLLGVLGLPLAEPHDGQEPVGAQLLGLVWMVGEQGEGGLEQPDRLVELSDSQLALGCAEQPPDLMLDVLVAPAPLLDIVEPSRRALELAAVQR